MGDRHSVTITNSASIDLGVASTNPQAVFKNARIVVVDGVGFKVAIVRVGAALAAVAVSTAHPALICIQARFIAFQDLRIVVAGIGVVAARGRAQTFQGQLKVNADTRRVGPTVGDAQSPKAVVPKS